MRGWFLARVAAAAADMIGTYPEAAAWLARRLEHIIAEEENRADERQRDERDERRRRGLDY